jgi:methionyl aminopeptidase
MITIKKKEDIEKLREGGKRLATILQAVSKKVVAGVTTAELDLYARELIEKGGDKAAFLNYTPEGIRSPYPAALCVSINEEVVHGIPTKRKKIKNGDVVSIDLGLLHDGLYTDHAITVLVGKGTPALKKLVATTKEAMLKGIEKAKAGARTGDIGYAIESVLKKAGYGVVRALSGHGVGYAVHEDPFVPNYGTPGEGEKLVSGMVIAIEPMATLGGGRVRVLSDEYTYVTSDKSPAAHFEHTVLITEKGPEILTLPR